MSTCITCNGTGLVSTGANKLDLSAGNTVVCSACAGTGAVDAPQSGSAPAPAPEAPKVDGASPAVPGGEASSQPSVKLPQIGDPCVGPDGVTPGTLDKDETGNWVCVPSQSAA